MNPAGVILTYMDLKDWKQWWFNIPLLIGQLAFLIVGKAYGKIPDLQGRNTDFWGFGKIIALAFLGFFLYLTAGLIYTREWLYAIPSFIMIYYSLWLFGGAKWNDIRRAAQCSHVRLCLKYLPVSELWVYINFGYPEAEKQIWRPEMIDGKRFEYRNPIFETSPQFIAAMIEYAEKQVGKGYDDLQLISNGLHLIAWIVYPPCWGKELKIIKALNRKGGREHCTSGFAADLRWAEAHSNNMLFKTFFDTDYFTGYHTAVIPPALVAIDENWRKA